MNKFIAAIILTVPSIAGAAGINTAYLSGYKDSILVLINQIIVPVLFAIAFLTFVWGVYKYFFLGAQSEAEKGDGRKFVLWGLIGFVVILSIWGLVAIVGGAFLGLTPGGTPPSAPIL